jgi:hypothetical protein
MELIKHQRDETVHNGIRSTRLRGMVSVGIRRLRCPFRRSRTRSPG